VTVLATGERARPDWVRRHPLGWVAAVATVCFGAFMGQLDASVVALTYHAIGSSFGASLRAVQWVTLSYLAVLGALLIPLGRLSDRIGRKRVYLWGFAVFTVSSAGCALAPSLGVLVALRAVQGAGAAMLQANSVAIVTTAAPRERLRVALGIQAAAQALGLALGPTLGGLVVETVGWRWVFAINIPVGIVALVAGQYLLPRTRLAPERPGALRRVAHLAPGLVGAVLAYLLLFGPIVLLPAVLQNRGTSALASGLAVATLPLGFAVGATVGNLILPSRWRQRRRGVLGLVLTAAGLAGLAAALPHPAIAAAVLAVAGVGLGVFTPVNNAQIMAAAPTDAVALAGGLVSAGRALGTALGTVLVTALLPVDASGRVAALALLAGVALATLSLRPASS
jgi:multidrug resistance protein